MKSRQELVNLAEQTDDSDIFRPLTKKELAGIKAVSQEEIEQLLAKGKEDAVRPLYATLPGRYL